MVCVKSLQLHLNRVLLLAVGLWPFEQSKFARVQLILFQGILVICIIFQFTTFMTEECNTQFVIEVLSDVFFFITLIIKYNTFSFNMNNVKHLLEVLQCTYNELRDDSEVAIIRKYGTIAKRYTYVLTLLSILGVSLIIFLPFWPRILGINVSSVNESRSHASLLIIAEHYVNHEKYFYLILLHITALCIGWTALVAVGTMTITYWLYACGIYQVASYRVEQALTNKALRIDDSLVDRRIICAIHMHRKALTFVKYFLSTIELPYFFLMLSIVIALSLNLYRVFDGLLSGVNIEKLISPSIFLTADYVLLFLANYISQQVKDHDGFLFTTAYSIQWYIAPLHVQRTILFILQRGTKSFNMNFAGFVVASREGFTTLTSLSISYFTVIYSMRQ